jgi:hypothetical protein
MLEKLRNLLARSSHHEDGSLSLLSSCMTQISTRLNSHLSGHYRWKDNEMAKTFECLILSKFLIDYALSTVPTRVSLATAHSQRAMSDAVFESLLKKTFPLLSLCDFVRNKLELYFAIMSAPSDPTCWQRLAGACTGVDYASEKDQSTLAASSLVLPALLANARDAWEQIV